MSVYSNSVSISVVSHARIWSVVCAYRFIELFIDLLNWFPVIWYLAGFLNFAGG